MYLVQGITDDPLQQQSLILPTGQSITLTMYYVPMQYGWFFTQILYGTFELDNLRICNSPNMLYQFRNILPFGLACFSSSDREPTQQEDFSSGYSSLYVLSAADVQTYTEYLNNGG